MRKNRIFRLAILPILILYIPQGVHAQLVSYSWPSGSGEATISDKYEVYITEGGGTEEEIAVLMSEATYAEADWQWDDLEGRTFSFVNLSYNPTGSNDLSIRVEKLFGSNASSISTHPISYDLDLTNTSGTSTSFAVDANRKYISLHFNASDNQSVENGWIEHMLVIFIDPLETDVPDLEATDLVYYTNSVSAADLENAKTIYFGPGYYNLRDYEKGGLIDDEGVLYLSEGQEVYLEGGAFVEGLINVADNDQDDIKIYGRGILTGRQYDWRKNEGFDGVEHDEIIRVRDDSSVEGITVMESPHHGIVGAARTAVKDLKYIGWHSNNDGFRLGQDSEVSHSFIRSVDDHFYNFDNYIHDCVIWAGHNGAILTFGWGGVEGSTTYNSGGTLMENIDVIHSEWINLGNNNGIIASQVGLDYQPYGYNDSTTTVLRNFRIEGSIPGIVNLKPRSENLENIAQQVTETELGYLGDLNIENFTIDDVFTPGLIRGESNATTDGNSAWEIQNIIFKDVSIGDVCLDVDNADTYVTIDETTSSAIYFECESGVGTPSDISNLVASVTSCSSVQLTWSDTEFEDEYRVNRRIIDGGGDVIEDFSTLEDIATGSTFYIDETVEAAVNYEYEVLPLQDNDEVASSNISGVLVPVCNIEDLEASLSACNQVLLTWSDRAGEEGYRIRRKIGTDDAFVNLEDVALNNTSYLDESALTNTAYVYQVRPLLGGVASGSSNEVEVTTLDCFIWTGDTDEDWATATNWNKGAVPGGSDDVLIPEASSVEIAGDVAVNDLFLEATDFTLNVDASLIIKGSYGGGGSLTVLKNVTGAGGYSILGSPVATVKAGDLDADSFYTYTSSGYEWVADNTILDEGKGYFVSYNKENPQVSFTGTPNVGEVSIEVESGFQLVANPYTAAITIEDFLSGNTSVLDGTVYFWDDGGENVGDDRGGDFITVNSMGVVGQNNLSDGVDGSQGVTAASNGFITTTQGVFVYADVSGQVSFTGDMQTLETGANDNDNHYRIHENDFLKIRLSMSNEHYQDDILIGFPEGATTEDDYGFDALKREGVAISFYSYLGDEKYAIQALPPISDETKVKLGYTVLEPGHYTLYVDQIEHLAEGLQVAIHDIFSDERYVLLEGHKIEFEVTNTLEDQSRFELIVERPPVLSVPATAYRSIEVYPNPVTDLMNVSGNLQGNFVKIYNVTGKLIKESTVEDHRLDLSELTMGIYVLEFHQLGTVQRVRFIKK